MRSQRVPLKITNFFKISVMSGIFGRKRRFGRFFGRNKPNCNDLQQKRETDSCGIENVGRTSFSK